MAGPDMFTDIQSADCDDKIIRPAIIEASERGYDAIMFYPRQCTRNGEGYQTFSPELVKKYHQKGWYVHQGGDYTYLYMPNSFNRYMPSLTHYYKWLVVPFFGCRWYLCQWRLEGAPF